MSTDSTTTGGASMKKPRRMKLPAPNAIVGGTLIGILLVSACIGALWTPYDPLKLSFREKLAAPSALHWLGTDEFGRDVLSRLMAGAATSVWISILTVTLAVVFGTLIGLFSGYMRGWTDRIIMAFNDALLAFPGILLALGLLAVVGANKYGIIVALGIAYTPSVARVVRGTVLSLREREFIAASRVMGNAEAFTMARHILPNCIAPLTVLATSMFGYVLLAESALSFLGLGVPPPAPSWGSMIGEGRESLDVAPRLAFMPAAAMFLTVLSFNLVGDTLRALTDPRQGAL
jgi:peptide/nickel transport system permease protein